jgi:hypothetical protein
VWVLLLLLLLLAGALVWSWGSWRKWDVRIQFLRCEGAGAGRTAPTSRDGARFAVFEIANRSAENLLVPYHPHNLSYELLSPDGETTTRSSKFPGTWLDTPPGASTLMKVPLLCSDGTPISGPFRVGFELCDKNGIRRREAFDRLPGWAKHWIYKVLPDAYFRNNTRVYWTERVTP